MTKFYKTALAVAALMMLGLNPGLADHNSSVQLAAGHGDKKGMKHKMMQAGDGIMVSKAWARATAKSAKNGAAYLTLSTNGDGDELLSVTGDVADKVELHTHANDNGVMRMREVKAIAVEPGSPTVLQPGGLHIMLLGLKAPLTEGDRFPLTLNFKSGMTKEVTITVSGLRGPKMDHGHNHKHGHHHK